MTKENNKKEDFMKINKGRFQPLEKEIITHVHI